MENQEERRCMKCTKKAEHEVNCVLHCEETNDDVLMRGYFCNDHLLEAFQSVEAVGGVPIEGKGPGRA